MNYTNINPKNKAGNKNYGDDVYYNPGKQVPLEGEFFKARRTSGSKTAPGMQIEAKPERKVFQKTHNPNNLEQIISRLYVDEQTSKQVIGKVMTGRPHPLTEWYTEETLPEYDGFVLDEERTLKIKPQLFVEDDGYTEAGLWIKKLRNAPLIFQRQTPSSIPLTEDDLPTYTIKLYRGALHNNDYPVDHHRFVFINDAKAGFRRFIHEWELYRRTSGTPKELEKIYNVDYDLDDAGHIPFFLWREYGKHDTRERMPRTWTASSGRASKDARNVENIEPYRNRLLEQSLIWCRLAYRAQIALRDGWSVYARYWDKKVDDVTVYLQLNPKLLKTKKVTFEELKEKAKSFKLKFTPQIKQILTVTQGDLENRVYVSLGKHVLGFYEAFVEGHEFDRMEGINESPRSYPTKTDLLKVLKELADVFEKKKSISSVANVHDMAMNLQEAIKILRRKGDKPGEVVLQRLFKVTQKAQNSLGARRNSVSADALPMLSNLIRHLGDLPPDGWEDPGTGTHITHAKTMTASIYKERNPSQIEVMKLSATTIAECFWMTIATRLQKETFKKTAEWLHRSAFSFGGLGNKSIPNTSQVPGNLVFGTYEANTFMLRYESSIKNLSMLEEEVSNSPHSVVNTLLSFNDDEWPIEIGGSQSWLAPSLLYEWNFKCTPIKMSTAKHPIKLFSRKIPTRFEVFLDELIESMLYDQDIDLSLYNGLPDETDAPTKRNKKNQMGQDKIVGPKSVVKDNEANVRKGAKVAVPMKKAAPIVIVKSKGLGKDPVPTFKTQVITKKQDILSRR